ncbi:MAG: Dihydrolipoamide succinyltransferase component (E2) of 2-oxoglutarate dehydrogenase complex (EC 2.3.1.61) [Olavius algarvensis Delta 4 endosymbiont]|nr:MAG: Dihydrolipoamide succinyltransferase component (E2) of 2-oxoglutarate dehydrogenase complex (EC 2.3.1.61) [Olavius algarvensis Delta 4 endosymbiont]
MDIIIPSVGESVQEAVLAEWFKQDGDLVESDEPLLVIETDKVTLEVVAEARGIVAITVPEGETVAIGAVVGTVTPVEGEVAQSAAQPKPAVAPEVPVKPEPEPEPAAPVAVSPPPALPADSGSLAPSVRRLIREKNLDAAQISGTGPGGRISKGDVLLYLEKAPAGLPDALPTPTAQECLPEDGQPLEVRKPMSPIRKRIAERLLESRQKTAMLTTFNEIDMRRAMALRAQYKQAFADRHGVSLGFMSFFIKACVEALKEIPEINAFLEGDEIIYHHYQHIGVAIGAPRGLVVPVVRHAERMNFAQVEQAIVDYVGKIKDNRLELADLEGGTFTVSNGGVYGSLLSTPILNTPQSGILGMHKIEKRPVVVDDEIVIRPMMYVALSYDHRIVDGKGAVTFLKRVKEYVENPERILLEV